MIFAAEEAAAHPVLSHGISGVVGFLGASLLNFLHKREARSTESLLKIIATYGERIMLLETRCEELHKDHSDCLKVTAAFAAELEYLKARQPDYRGPNRNHNLPQG